MPNNPLATDEEMAANALHYKAFSLKPEAVVLKLFDSLQTGNYQRAASCLDPERKANQYFRHACFKGL